VYATAGSYPYVYALDADDGTLLWSSPKGEIGLSLSPPTVVNGNLFITDTGKSFDGITARLYKYNLVKKTKPLIIPPSPPVSHNFNVNISGKSYDFTKYVTTGNIYIYIYVYILINNI
jgi:outer membrane protein assembly factor BamB